MEAIEKVAETVEAAIQAGLRELNCGPDDVMVEVLEEPSRGFLGIGARPARVRLIFIGRRPEPTKPVEAAAPSAPPRKDPAPKKERPPRQEAAPPKAESAAENTEGSADEAAGTQAEGERKRRRRRGGRGRGGERTEQRQERGGRDRRQNGASYDYDYADDEGFSAVPSTEVIADADADEDARVGKEVLLELLDKMGYQEVQITLHRAESTRDGEETHWILNIMGQDVQTLAARRGETLASLQYILRLMLSRRLQRRVNIIVNVAEYKLHRAQRLQQLATRMADQAVAQGRTITLEPMPPNERRIIHLTLRERQDVETRSIGEGNARKVTIAPVKP